jgi:hypothetical protein
VNQHATITPPGGYSVRRITDPAAYVAALEAREKIIQKKANRVHGKPGVDGIFRVLAVHQKKLRKKYKPPNYLSAPSPGAPEAWLSNLSIYRMRTVRGWILPPKEESLLLFLAKLDDLRPPGGVADAPFPTLQGSFPTVVGVAMPYRPDLAELDKNHIQPPRRWWYQSPKSDTWEKRWRRARARGIWPEPNLKTWSFRWVKNGLALHHHKRVLRMVGQRRWLIGAHKPITNPARHLPFEDRVAAAMLGLAIAIRRFDVAKHDNNLTAYATLWIIKELQHLAKTERRALPEDHKPYGFEGEFGPGIPVSFWPRTYPLVSYDENTYRRRPQFINIGGDCVVENIKLGAPADDNDDVEHAGPSFVNWSPISPETALLWKEATFDKYKYRSAAEIVQMCDGHIDAATVHAVRNDWRAQKKRNRVVTPAQPIMDLAAFEMVSLPASVFAPV